MAKKASSEKHLRKKNFLKQPKYEGGSIALKKFVGENMVYPSEALEHKIQGDVQVRYDVDEHGQVISAKVLRGIGYGCDEEALRIVRLLKYLPARNRGAHVTSHLDIVLHFRLPGVIEPPAQANSVSPPPSLQIQYAYTPTSVNTSSQQPIAETTPPSPQKPNSYTWVVTVANKKA